jgi:hypothetical protein
MYNFISQCIIQYNDDILIEQEILIRKESPIRRFFIGDPNMDMEDIKIANMNMEEITAHVVMDDDL